MAKTRRNRRLRTLRGGGTASWGFAPASVDRTMNNPMAWAPSSCSHSSHASVLGGGGLPGLSTGAGVSLQKGGGGPTHYGFNGGGLAGGNGPISTNCGLPQSGGSGQLNLPIAQSPLGKMAGGRRSKRQQKKTRKNSSRRNRQSRRR